MALPMPHSRDQSMAANIADALGKSPDAAGLDPDPIAVAKKRKVSNDLRRPRQQSIRRTKNSTEDLRSRARARNGSTSTSTGTATDSSSAGRSFTVQNVQHGILYLR